VITFTTGVQRFSLRAAAVLVHDGAVLLHRAEGDPCWALPGGRVELGESGAETVVREMQEELGETVQCGPLLWIAESFFMENALERHEIGLYFAAQLPPDSPVLAERAPFYRSEGALRLIFCWFALSELATINVVPSFLVSGLAAPAAGPVHVVQREF
jgi:8-oxo-dGTP pyrophosphatase MutT (NUDIX family)